MPKPDHLPARGPHTRKPGPVSAGRPLAVEAAAGHRSRGIDPLRAGPIHPTTHARPQTSIGLCKICLVKSHAVARHGRHPHPGPTTTGTGSMDVPPRLSRHLRHRALSGPGSPSDPRGFAVRLRLTGLRPLRNAGRILLAPDCPPPAGEPTAVAEVVHRDRSRHVWIVAPVDGPWAAWYQCLRHKPAAVVKVGRRRHHVSAYFLSPAEGTAVMAEYASRRPRAARALYRRLGLLRKDGRDAQRDAAGRIALVRLTRYPTL